MPCNPSDLTITEPNGPPGLSIPGFGKPFSPPDISLPIPEGFPEDLLEILDLLQMILPPGIVKAPLNPNFGKDIFDAIMKLLDQFMPFLMMYKFFLPVLELIICIIEVLCAIPNPFKLIKALKKLFRRCLPNFLSLFPYFALILMLISLLLLILALIEYIIAQILKLILLILKNIRALVKATTKADGPSILAITKKLGIILCAFQNFFVLLAIFKAIIDMIKDMLALIFQIPPCDDGDNSNPDNCCSTDVCPDFIRNNETMIRSTGTLKYLNRASYDSGTSLGGLFGNLMTDIRPESWQFYDADASVGQAFYNITSAYDLPEGITQIFFPTDATYNASTPPGQAPYTVDLRLQYDPNDWGRGSDPLGPRFIRIKDCIVTQAPTTDLSIYDVTTTSIPTGVIKIAGGRAVEDDGLTQIFVDASTGVLENFVHMDAIVGAPPILNISDGYTYTDIEYTFKIKHEVLLGKALITLGCIPTVALDRVFINSIFGAGVGANFTLLNNLVRGLHGKVFPDIAAAQECLTTAVVNLGSNMSEVGVANFQAHTTVCLNKLKDDTAAAIEDLVSIGFDSNQSTFTLDPAIQFTSQPIIVSVALNERSTQPLSSKLPTDLAANLAAKIVPIIDFGAISPFTYDGSQFFTAEITSKVSGAGTIKMSFDDTMFSTVTIPDDVTETPSVIDQVLDYAFIYSPSIDDGKVARDEGDVSREGEE